MHVEGKKKIMVFFMLAIVLMVWYAILVQSYMNMSTDILTPLLRLLQITSGSHGTFNIKERVCGSSC